MMKLRFCELALCSEFPKRYTSHTPGMVRRSDRVGVYSEIIPDAPRACASVSQGAGNRIVGMAWADKYRTAKRVLFTCHLNDVARLQLLTLSQGRANEQRVIPCELGDWFGTFLEPTIVGKAAIPDGWIGAKDLVPGMYHH